jgi:serine protease Do
MRRSAKWTARLSPAIAALVLIPLFAALSHSAPPTPPSPAAAPPASVSAGALPESYPWVRLAEAARPAVVNVRVKTERTRASGQGDEGMPESFRRFLPPGLRDRMPDVPRERRGLGSGFVIDQNGYIVTNHHVVDGAQTIEVAFDSGRTLPGKVVGTDPETDLALIKVEATGLPTLALGRSTELKVGEPVMAIGNPFGLDHTVTVGVISGTSRVIGAGRYDDFLQTDAAINPGNSGGPLINTRGQVVGIAAAIASQGGGFQGVGFAIPMDLAQPIVQQLRAEGRVARGWLGVSIQPITPELATSFGLKGREGALVASVAEGSPAAQGGVRPGDVIMRYDGKVVDSPRVLSSLVAATASGRTVEMSVIRDGRAEPLRVTIAPLKDTRRASAVSRPAAPTGLGIEVEPLTPERARRLGVTDPKGVVVTEVRPGSPAADAGVSQGDVIREVNKVPVESADDLQKSISRSQPQKQVLLRVEREGAARFVVIQLG